MFGVSGVEFLVILLVGLIVLGPEKLPDAMRKTGRVVSELRRMSNGFQAELRDALDEPYREVKGTFDSARQSLRDTAGSVTGGFDAGARPTTAAGTESATAAAGAPATATDDVTPSTSEGRASTANVAGPVPPPTTADDTASGPKAAAEHTAPSVAAADGPAPAPAAADGAAADDRAAAADGAAAADRPAGRPDSPEA